MKKIFSFILFFISIYGMSYCETSRAVLLFQSNSIDLHIADIDVKRNKLIQTTLLDSEKVAFSDDLNKNARASMFSSNIQEKAIDALKKLLKKAEPFNVEAIQAFAIDVFREAKNAEVLIKRIKDETKIDVSILSEEQQGIVEFIAIVDALKMNPEKTLAWKMDWKFFRLTAKCEENYAVFIGQVHQKIFSDVIDFLEKKDELSPDGFDVIPLTEEDLKQEKLVAASLLKDIPQCILDKATHPETIVLGFGDNLPKYLIEDNNKITRRTFQQALQNRIGKWEEKSKSKDLVTYPAAMMRNVYGFAVADLILITSVMDALDIQNVRWTSAKPDLTVGCLLYQEFWKMQNLKPEQ